MDRLARLVIPGLPHHVTQRGNSRLGRLTRRVDRRGWVRDFSYDGLSRNTQERWYYSVEDADLD
ncbi:MAG: hypothetical protein JXB10_19415 [Pirellulales bacterium]|nr:hypothetical protein [Pirellulales bacterium]